MEAQKTARREARRGRSALHAHGRRRRPLRAASARAPTSRSSSASSATRIEHKRFHEDYVKIHTNGAVHHQRQVRLRRRALHRLRRGEGRVRQGRPGPTRRIRRRKAYCVDPTHEEPALRLPAPEEARRPLHAGDGRADLRHAARSSSSRSPRWSTSTGNAARVGTITYALGLDAALDRRADHPRRGDAAAPARQRRPAGRRRQRVARPLEHPGRHRHRPARSRSCPAT